MARREMSEIDETEDKLSCTFCKEKFSDVVKLIPECHNNICGRCYDDLKEDADETSNEYKCVACKEIHTLPSNGLHDNKELIVAIRKINSTEKPLHPNAKRLRELVREIEAKLSELRSLNGKQVIEIECEQLEQKLKDAVESAVDHLKEIETKMMKQISEYRERCLANHHFKQISEPENVVKLEVDALSKEVGEFNAKWNDYFGRIEVYATESEIEDALLQTALYVSTIESMEVTMKKEALNSEKMVFKVNSQFLEEWNHVGKIEIIREKKMTIQQTPSFTLTGHSNEVRQVLFLPDGRLASCSEDETIKIWNVENGKELFQLKGHTGFVYSIALLPNGHLASCSDDETIKIWHLGHRKEIRSIKAQSYDVVSLRVLKNGNLASYSWDDTIKIWNLNSKEDEPILTMRGHGNTSWWYQLFGILSNNNFVTCSRHWENKEECILRLWNRNEPNPINSIQTGLNDARSLLVLSNDQVALGFQRSGTITIIDLVDDVLSRTKKRAHNGEVYSLAQLSNGNLVSAGKDGSNYTIKVWDLLDLGLIQTITSGHTLFINSFALSADEQFLASGCADWSIKLWPISTQ